MQSRRKEGDNYFLVTPVEKVRITVEDVPFIAVDFEKNYVAGLEFIIFRTNVDDYVKLSKEHPIRIEINPITEEPLPYLLVRDNIEARIDRKSFYRLIDIGEVQERDQENWFGVRSGDDFFPIAPERDLN